jgi:hypothetical protein
MSATGQADVMQAGEKQIDEAEALAAFAGTLRKHGGLLDPVAIFHAVRRMPYLSTGDRSLSGIIRRRAGSCSSKHILLAELLNREGIPARVIIVRGDFAAPLRDATGIPPDLLAAGEGGIPDYHNVVRAWIGGRECVLDATWHDAMKPYGFRVNDGWHGAGDCTIALDVEEWIDAEGDVAAHKARLIARWPEIVQARRRRFLEAINQWVETIGVETIGQSKTGLGGPP